MISLEELEQQFDEAVPILFQKDAVELIVKCYREAETIRDTYGIRNPVSWWHRPYVRRALIESQLFELAERYTLQPQFKYTLNTLTPYLEIRAGNFVITE